MMSNVLVIRKQDPNSLGNVNMAVNSQGVIPQLNLTGGQNIPMSGYFGPRYDPTAMDMQGRTPGQDNYRGAYQQKPQFGDIREGPQGIVEGGDTNFYYNNQSYGAGNKGREAAHEQYGLDREAHDALPDYNLTTGQRVAGLASSALPAAWSALSALSDDSQGDVFSTLGRAGLGALATRSASAPLEQWAVDAAGKRRGVHQPQYIHIPRYTPSNPTMTPQTSVQTNLDTTTANSPAETTANSPAETVIADPTNRELSTKERVNAQVEEANRIQAENPISMQSAELGDSESDATRDAVENASKVTEATRRKIADEATGQDTQQIGLDGKPVKKARAWSYY